jgi:hypothetical protein
LRANWCSSRNPEFDARQPSVRRNPLHSQQERPVLCRVDAETGKLERVLAFGRGSDARPPRKRLHPGHELGHAEWLGEVVVRAERQRGDLVVLVAASAHGQDRRHQALVTCALDQSPAVQARQHQVDDADVGPLEAQLAQAAVAVVGPLDVESAGAQMRPHCACDHAVVLDHEYRSHPEVCHSRRAHTRGRRSRELVVKIR